MDLQLKNKSALITGSTAGIGLAIASALAGEGAHVIVNGRTEARVQSAAAQIKHWHAGATVRAVTADLGTAAGVARLTELVGEVDILVNNLGIFVQSVGQCHQWSCSTC